MKTTQAPRILRIDASARGGDSVSRGLADEVIGRLKQRHPGAEILHRDLSRGIPLIDEAWIGANFSDPATRTPEQVRHLAVSEELLGELEHSDILVLATPLYNFGIPAVLKAWVDQVMRARRSFRYTEQGPVGLLKDRPVYLLMATGGTQVGGEMDYASGYLSHVLGFMGIRDIRLVAADQVNSRGGKTIEQAQRAIADLFELTRADAA